MNCFSRLRLASIVALSVFLTACAACQEITTHGPARFVLPPRLPASARRAELKPTPLNIHGPFHLSASALAKMRQTTVVSQAVHGESDEARLDSSRRQLPITLKASNLGLLIDSFVPSAPSHESPGPPGPPPDGPPPAPAAKPSVVLGTAAGTTDPQIAVGGKDVVVTIYNRLFLFHKAELGVGLVPIQLNPGADVSKLATVIKTEDFFSPLTADINSHLNQPKGYGVNEGYGINPAGFPGKTYYDARTIYDSYRKCFWVIALAITQKASPSTAGTLANPIRESARRTKIAVAVSQTDDAFGHWNYYWWDGNQDEDSDPRIISTQYFSHVDYPLLGISEKYVLVENRADICHVGVGTADPNTTPPHYVIEPQPCTPPDPNLHTENYDYVTVAPADQLFAGSVPEGKFLAHRFKSLQYPNGIIIPPGNSMVPAVHHGFVPFGMSFFANLYVDANDKSWLQVSALNDLDKDDVHFEILPFAIRDLQFWNGEYKDSQDDIYYGNADFRHSPYAATPAVISAAFRGEDLVVTLAEPVNCPTPASTIRAIRLIRVNVVSGAVKIDRTFGRRTASDPADVDCVGYYQPAVEVNKDGDVAVVYWRSSGKIPTEARYSVIYNSGLQPPSALLHAGTGSSGGGFETSGISLDPDDRAIWFLQAYQSPTGAELAIGRIWGQ